MTAWMGIVNVTPDSFSDGGAYGAPQAALAQCAALASAGASIIDIGAESTRPGAQPVSPQVEWERLAPVLEPLDIAVPVSVDTRHATTAARALERGASIINDQSALGDPAMGEVVAKAGCKLVVMHTLGLPADRHVLWPEQIDPVAEILRWKAAITARAAAYGIAHEQLIFDPGLGFGKRPLQSLALVNRAPELVASGGAWLYGHSRKSFLSVLTDAEPMARDRWTLVLSRWLAHAGVQYLRVHNIALHREAGCI